MKELYEKLPKWVKVIPYILAAGAVAELIKHLELLNLSDVLLMGLVNVVIVALKGLLAKLMEIRK
jgi:hypothetical protein